MENKIQKLVVELVMTLDWGGYLLQDKAVDENFGSCNIWLHNIGTENAKVILTKVGVWEIEIPVDFKFKTLDTRELDKEETEK